MQWLILHSEKNDDVLKWMATTALKAKTLKFYQVFQKKAPSHFSEFLKVFK